MTDAAPAPPRRFNDGEAVVDALRYPLHRDALIANVVLTLSQLAVGFVPLVGLFLQVVIWMSTYRYALEIMTASGQGRSDPPQGSLLTEVRSQHSHFWLQAVIVISLVAATLMLPPNSALLILLGVALILPGALLAMASAQNMLAAINPMAWLAVLRIVGPGYVLMAAALAVTLLVQIKGPALISAWLPAILASALYFLCVQAALFGAFRLLGTRLYAHANALGFEDPVARLPELARDREQAALAQEARVASHIEDPKAKAAALAPIVRRGGASDTLQQEYRRCLRAAGDRAALRQHAQTWTSELLVLQQPKHALALATEALADDPDFSLPDASAVATLLRFAEGAGQPRIAVELARNYQKHYPKRYDGLPLALAAARLLADRLGDADGAAALLEAGAALAAGGPEAAEFERLRKRLRAGIGLG